MKAVPITLRDANAFVIAHHRHSLACRGHKFAVGVELDGVLVGVGIAGRPVARKDDDGLTLEILRVCTDGTRNAGSFLYARLKRIGQLMGYQRFTTKSLTSESGDTLRGVGAKLLGETNPRGWDRPGRKRIHQAVYDQPKFRWEL